MESFFQGIYLHCSDRFSNDNSKFNQFDLLSLLVVSFLLLSYALEAISLPSLSFMQYFWPSFPALIGLLLVSLSFSTCLVSLVELRLFKITATLSYGIYLWHIPVQNFMNSFFFAGEVDGVFKGLLFAAFSLLITYLVAMLSYYLLEKRVLDKANRF